MKREVSKSNPSLEKNLLNAIVQTAKDGILILDQGGVVQYANQAVSRMFRPEVEDLIGHALKITEKTERITIKDSGTPQTVLELHTSRIDYQGNPAMLVLARDISKQAAVEKLLKNYKQLLEATGETAKIGGWIINSDDGSIWLSDIVKQILEIPKDQPLDLETGFTTLPEDVGAAVEEAVRLLMTTGKSFDMDVPYDKPSGERIWLHITGQAECEHGKSVQAWGTVQDITEKRDAETRAIEGETRRQQLFDYALSSFALAEAMRDDRGKIVNFVFIDVNKNFEAIFNIPWGKVVGALATETIRGLIRTILFTEFVDVVENKTTKQIEYYSENMDRIFLLSVYSPGAGPGGCFL